MASKSCLAHDFYRAKFAQWLAGQSIIIEPSKGDYELLRYSYGRETCLVFKKPSKGRITFSSMQCWEHYLSFLQAGVIAPPEIKPAPIHTAPLRDHYRLYTDASLNSQTCAGAWAAILVCPDNSAQEVSGPLKGDILSSTAAEIAAVANAMHRFLAGGIIRPNTQLVVLCDNKAAVGYLSRQKCKPRGLSANQTKAAFAYIKGLASKDCLHITAKWVRGHQPENAESLDITMNRRADKLARKHGLKLHRERMANAKEEKVQCFA
jgi:ribonuclease HI